MRLHHMHSIRQQNILLLLLLAVLSLELSVSNAFVVPQRRLQKHLLRSTASSSTVSTVSSPSSSSSIKNDSSNGKVPHHLVEALDLQPLMRNVAKHAGTKRARDALMAMVHLHDNDPNDTQRGGLIKHYNNSKKKQLLSTLSGAGASSFSATTADGGSYRIQRSTKHIVKVAESLSEAQAEWEMIAEVTRLLEGHNNHHPSSYRNRAKKRNKNNNNNKKLKEETPGIPLPPIYGMDASPWSMSNDLESDTDTDDDEWLQSILAGYRGMLELEQILQADMVLQRIVNTYEWTMNVANSAASASGSASTSSLVKIFQHVDLDTLKEIQEEIEGTVQIIKGEKSTRASKPLNESSNGASSFVTPKTFEFVLNPKKFPNLSLLQKKETNLVHQIDATMQTLLSNKKYASQLSGLSRRKSNSQPESYELDGRTVVTVSNLEVAKQMGIVRGHSRTNSGSSICYVEPTEVVKLGNELVSLREEIHAQQLVIVEHISSLIGRNGGCISYGLDAVARLDGIFARAAFGYTLNGYLPDVKEEGVIRVDDFVHPVLATKGSHGGGTGKGTVPIDLKISCENLERTLIISGPNGGGKSLAMKSFGLAAMMVKLGVPIPRDDFSGRSIDDTTRIDFFDDILVELGDHQSLLAGESTYQAHLKSMSTLLDRVSSSGDDRASFSSLILLDELGGGTDPTAGACIAQAILEKILENTQTRTIVTTHSTQLKALSIDDDRFNSASVLLQAGGADGSRFRLPTYKLCYGAVGNSYALGAASRCDPPIPDDVLDRAANLIASSQDKTGEYMRTITEALEQEKEALAIATEVTDGYRNDIIRCRDAMVALARSYEQNLSRIETRLDDMYDILKEDETKNAYDLVGDSLLTLRITKKAVKSREEMLKEKGMRVVTMTDNLSAGDQVMIISEGDFKGESAIVSLDQSKAEFDEIVVELGFDDGLSLLESNLSVTQKRSNLAVWDYPSYDEDWSSGSTEQYERPRSVPDSRNRLLNVLSTLNTDQPTVKKAVKKTNNSGSKYSSSRQRKAASKKANKKKKR